MFDFNLVLGLDEKTAKNILAENGYNNIETITNSKHNDLCDSLIVCSVQEHGGKVTLVCGEFYLNLKR